MQYSPAMTILTNFNGRFQENEALVIEIMHEIREWSTHITIVSYVFTISTEMNWW